MKKLSEINEGWGSLVRRDLTGEVRDEEKQSPFFGEGIGYKFYAEGDNKLFTWEEALKIEKSMEGWRIPTEEDFNRCAKTGMCILEYTMYDGYAIVESKYGELKVPLEGFIGTRGVIRMRGTMGRLWVYNESHVNNLRADCFTISPIISKHLCTIDAMSKSNSCMILLIKK